MIQKTLFTDMAKKVFRRGRGLRDPQIMHPEREWAIGLCVMVLIFAASAAWSATVYLKNKNVNADQTAVDDGEAVYREPQVKEALRMAQERGGKLSGLLGIVPTVPTPEEDLSATTTATTTEEAEVIDKDAQATTTEGGEQ